MKHRAGFKTNAPSVLLPSSPPGEVKATSFSRRGFSRPSFAQPRHCRSVSRSNPVMLSGNKSDCFVATAPRIIDDRPRPSRGTKNKRKRNAGRRIVSCPHASGVRDAPRRKAACAALRLRARSPAGVPLAVLASGTFVPKAQRRARLPEEARKLRRAARTARSQRCTSRAGRSAGRHDARAARVRSVSFRPRAPHSLRLQGVPSRKASFKSEIGCGYCLRASEVKRR